MRRRFAWLALGAAALAGLGIAIGAVLLYSGRYSVAATEQHLRPTFRVLDVGLRRSVQHHARAIEPPPLEGTRLLQRGLACFRLHCEQCHGAPGVDRAEFAKGLLPVPSSLSQAAHDWAPAELYWITRYGIKMTGMPAWQYRLDEEALWAIVAFLQALPEMRAESYARQAGAADPKACGTRSDASQSSTEGDPMRGAAAIQQYACTACHRIPGIVGPNSYTGPVLTDMGRRRYIAGVLPNTEENMVRWLRAPQTVNPHTAMPDTGVTEEDARDIAAYLATVK